MYAAAKDVVQVGAEGRDWPFGLGGGVRGWKTYICIYMHIIRNHIHTYCNCIHIDIVYDNLLKFKKAGQ